MQVRALTLIGLCCGVIGCADYTTPAAVRLNDGRVLVGTTTASINGGRFEVTDQQNLTCAGTYDALDTRPTISAPVICNDGRTGTVTITRARDGRSGQGLVRLSDGTTGQAAFGNLATLPATPSVSTSSAASSAAASRTSQPVRIATTSPSTNARTPIRGPYTGTCDCPYDRARDGSRCGGRSAYSRPGGRSPRCYE